MLRNLNLSVKLIGGFMMIGLLLLIGGFVGSLGISHVSGDLKSFSEGHLPGIYHLATMAEAQQNIAVMEQSLLTLQPSDRDGKKRLFQRLKRPGAVPKRAESDTMPCPKRVTWRKVGAP